ncbi:MAG: response regulator [Oscillospiraceae bacterium]|nr:response regulator [Oscillospiraceae bacterium]
MKMKSTGRNRGFPLLLSIVLVFCILGMIVFSVSRKISQEMSESAIQNLNDSLDLIQYAIETILNKETEFQLLIAQEIAAAEDPIAYIRSREKNNTMVKISLILTGETEGISNTGEQFSEAGLDFSMERRINGLPVSQSYLNYMGTWAYCIKCPVEREGQEIASLYIEYVYDTLDKLLPDGFYNGKAILYVMDPESERFVLKPKGRGLRDAGHLNLEDFYRANSIEDPTLKRDVAECLKNGINIMFYHDIRSVNALIYMWPVNDGSLYLVGYVPIEAIQQEGRTVNQNILIVVLVMLIAFFLCCLLYYLNQRQQNKLRKEREIEREIHNRQLAQALQAAQIASNSKTTFLSNMSHDIRTPMNAVLGFTTLLAMEADNPVKVREYTKKITASGQHLLSLINDILDVSKIESGKVVLNFEPFSLNDLVSSVDAIIQPMAKGKHQNFHVEVSGIKHEYFIGDETRVNQILINLLSNAVKYTQEYGNIWFRIVGLKQRSAQYDHIRIEVEDDGYGMTQEYLKTIFDAFTRAENSTTNKVQGTGLGMAITKSIVELMGGTIEVFSEIDKGSLFRVELEFRIPEDQVDQQFWDNSGINQMLVANGAPETCRDIVLLMKNVGVQVDTVSSVEEALELIQKDSEYHVLLLDWELPDLEGTQTVQKLRVYLPDTVPILFLAAFDTVGIDGVLELAHTGLLTKPFFVSALKEKILELRGAAWEKDQAGGAKENSLAGLHFLAAEDNEINAEILEEILKMEGANCEIVENGQLAVERFACAAKGEFDAILMDVQMPVMNGYDATRVIRALKRADAGEIPIIAMTANAFAEDEKAALDAGMNAHVAKPIDVALLKKVIERYVKRKE